MFQKTWPGQMVGPNLILLSGGRKMVTKKATKKASNPKTKKTKTAAKKPAAKKTAAKKNIRKAELQKTDLPISDNEIATRAYYIWENNGCQIGNDQMNWFEAEKQLKKELHR
jgi:hypothetical protein